MRIKISDTDNGHDYVIDKELISEICKEHTTKFLYTDLLIKPDTNKDAPTTGVIK